MPKVISRTLTTSVSIFLFLISFALHAGFPDDELAVPKTKTKHSTALTIAGSDPSGGAGLQADLKTFSALRCYGMSVVTALTAQNTQGVQAIHPALHKGFLTAQLESIFSDIGVNATKIGMLGTKETIEEVIQFLRDHNLQNIVIDPVMFSKTGHLLLQEDAIETLRKLLPFASVLTPNVHEASKLLGLPPITTEDEMLHAAQSLLALGPTAVIVKGGPCSPGNDCLVMQGKEIPFWLRGTPTHTSNLHGTGCSFSAALTSYLARGDDIIVAARNAKQYITHAIEEGSHYTLGKGSVGPVHHFYLSWSQPPFSQRVWLETMPLFARIKEHPFLKGMVDNSLEDEKFRFYVHQDSFFLKHRAEAYSILASRASTTDVQDYLKEKAEVTKAAALFIFEKYSIQPESVEESPASKRYGEFLIQMAREGSFYEALASHAPCSLMYQKLGEHLRDHSAQPNKFQVWISTYSSALRRKNVEVFLDIIDDFSETAKYEDQELMRKAFFTAAQLEFGFWESAFKLGHEE